MGKAVLISIQPKWCERIASGQKTLEIRKNRPKLETPFKCYIYCTNKRPFLVWGDVFRGDWYTEFTHLSGYSREEAERIWDVFNGKVIGEFVCKKIEKYFLEQTYEAEDAPLVAHVQTADIKAACLNLETVMAYSMYPSPKSLYGWHITDLVIYDTPCSLNKFRKPELPTGLRYEDDAIKRPPQSWCYVEELRGCEEE